MKNVSLVLFGLMIILSSCIAQRNDDGFINIFDGSSLKGWKGDTAVWKVLNGAIVGENTAQNPIKSNTFLIYDDAYGDFELKAEFRITASGNSGIQYRSEILDSLPFTLTGYQADIDGNNVYTGQNYEERGRGFLAKRGEVAMLEKGKQPQITSMIADPDSLKSLIKKEDWNEIHIVAIGNRMRHFVNGVLMSEVTDNDGDLRRMRGVIGFQVHSGPPMKIEYRQIRIKK